MATASARGLAGLDRRSADVLAGFQARAAAIEGSFRASGIGIMREIGLIPAAMLGKYILEESISRANDGGVL